MTVKRVSVYFVGLFVLVFFVTAIVTFLYSYAVHGTAVVDWETAFRFAMILGIVLTWTNFHDKKKEKE